MPESLIKQAVGLGRSTILELAPSVAPESFGVGYAALHLSAAIARRGLNVYLVSVEGRKEAYEACEQVGFPRQRMIVGSPMGPPRLRISPFLLRQISTVTNGGRRLIHMHGPWTYVSYAAAVLRKRWQCPFVMSPHGMLEAKALAMSRWKKALASLLYERSNFLSASCLWALSDQEKVAARSYGCEGKIAVIPNGVSPALECSPEELVAFRRKHSVPENAPVLLFLSRIAYQKNLPLLLHAFAGVIKACPGWVLILAGNDERGQTREVESLIQNLEIGPSVRLIGPVLGKEKACALTTASIFVLASLWEGLPIAALEAMEYGKPVLTTDVWQLPVRTSARYGWRVPVDLSAFQTSLLEAMSTPRGALVEMGENARSIIRQHFTWETVADQACSLYASLLAERRAQHLNNRHTKLNSPCESGKNSLSPFSSIA